MNRLWKRGHVRVRGVVVLLGFLAGLACLLSPLVRQAEAGCNAPGGTIYDLSVTAAVSSNLVPVGSTVIFSYIGSSSPPGYWPSTAGNAVWSPYSPTSTFANAGVFTNWITISTPAYGSCAATTSAVVTVVQVDHVEYQWGPTGWTNAAPTNYVPANTNVQFKALPYPGVAWPSGKPVWGGVSTASSNTASATFTPGEHAITAECGNVVTARMAAIAVEVDPAATNVCWGMTNQVAIIVTTNSYAPGGITWSGTNGLKVLSVTDTNLVFTPTNSTPTNYEVRAAATGFTNCYITSRVGVRKVDIVQTQVVWAVGLSNNAPFCLTADSTTNTTWTIIPDLAGGAKFAAASNVTGTVNTWSGTNVWVTPGLTMTNYMIRAYADDLTNCQDTAKFIVISNFTIIAESLYIAVSNTTRATAWTIDGAGVAVPTNSDWTIPVGDSRAAFVSGATYTNALTNLATVTIIGTNVSTTMNDVQIHAAATGNPVLADDEWFTVLRVDLDIDVDDDGDVDETDESKEESPGVIIFENWDNDDGDAAHTPDKDETSVTGENDLVPFYPKLEPTLTTGTLKLEAT
ncbi:MAG: hypothetical protein WCG36_09540, partial [bacterium]